MWKSEEGLATTTACCGISAIWTAVVSYLGLVGCGCCAIGSLLAAAFGLVGCGCCAIGSLLAAAFGLVGCGCCAIGLLAVGGLVPVLVEIPARLMEVCASCIGAIMPF